MSVLWGVMVGAAMMVSLEMVGHFPKQPASLREMPPGLTRSTWWAFLFARSGLCRWRSPARFGHFVAAVSGGDVLDATLERGGEKCGALDGDRFAGLNVAENARGP